MTSQYTARVTPRGGRSAVTSSVRGKREPGANASPPAASEYRCRSRSRRHPRCSSPETDRSCPYTSSTSCTHSSVFRRSSRGSARSERRRRPRLRPLPPRIPCLSGKARLNTQRSSLSCCTWRWAPLCTRSRTSCPPGFAFRNHLACFSCNRRSLQDSRRRYRSPCRRSQIQTAPSRPERRKGSRKDNTCRPSDPWRKSVSARSSRHWLVARRDRRTARNPGSCSPKGFERRRRYRSSRQPQTNLQARSSLLRPLSPSQRCLPCPHRSLDPWLRCCQRMPARCSSTPRPTQATTPS